MVHLLHRLYGVDAPDIGYLTYIQHVLHHCRQSVVFVGYTRGEDKREGGLGGLSPPNHCNWPPPPKHDERSSVTCELRLTVNTKYCPHTSCTNSVINVISDVLQVIVIAVDTHASQLEFLITKSLMINTCMNCNILRLSLIHI